MSSCNCEDTLLFPTVEQDQSILNGTVLAPCCDETEDESTESSGSTLTTAFTDAGCANENVTLLGRVGNRLTRFTTTGFIKITKGKASIVQSIPVAIGELYHKWFKTSGGMPVIGDPLDHPYNAIADASGKVRGIKGFSDADSIQYWNATLGLWQIIKLPTLQKCHTGLLPRVEELELVGFAPIPEGATGNALTRCLSTLAGSGIIVVEQQATIPSNCDCDGCEPEAALASVAKFLPNPEGEGTFTLKFSTALGHHWSEA